MVNSFFNMGYKNIYHLLFIFTLLFVPTNFSFGAGGENLKSEFINKKAPRMARVDVVSGKYSSFARPLLVEFWATWCPPCIRTIPHLNKLYGKVKKENKLKFISLTYESKAKVRKFMKRLRMDYPVGIDVQGVNLKRFKVRGIPIAFLIDKKRKIRWEGFPGHLTHKILKDFLNLPENRT